MSSPSKPSRVILFLTFLIPTSLAIALRIPFLDLPLERDEGEYAYIAWLWSHGGVPYRDAFDQKPPGVFFLYYLAFALLGPGVTAIRATLLITSALSTLVFTECGRRLHGNPGGFFGGIAFALLTTAPSLWATAANTEVFMLLPLGLALITLFPGKAKALSTSLPRLLLAGALLGVAFLFKQVGFFFGLALLPFFLSTRRMVHLAVFLGGVIITFFLATIPFLATGTVGDFIECAYLHNFGYVGSACQTDAFLFLRQVLANIAKEHWVLLLFSCLGFFIALAQRTPGRIFVFLWFISALAGTALGCRFFPHYFLAAAAPLSLLVGFSFAWFKKFLVDRNPLIGLALSGTFAAAIIFPAVLHNQTLYSLDPERISQTLYGAEIFPIAETLGEYIRENTSQTEEIFILGSEPQILFHAQRRSVTRYIFTYPLTGPYQDAAERQDELLREVQEKKPAMILCVNVPYSLGLEEGSSTRFIEETRSYLQRGYALEGAVLWRKNRLVPYLGKNSVHTVPTEVLSESAALLYRRLK